MAPSFFLFCFIFLFLSCSRVHSYHYQIPLAGDVIGPEDIAFDCVGSGPYVSVSDGRILQWQGPVYGWKEFAFTAQNRPRHLCDGHTNTSMEHICGRPLGLKFNPRTCELYIADAYFGLMVVGRNGGRAQLLANSAEGIPFRFTNALDVDTYTGDVYFTDSSMYYQRRNNSLLVGAHDITGRLLRYDPWTRQVDVVARGLQFPNGLALSKDNSFILVVESNTNTVWKLQLGGTRPPYITRELFTRVLVFPDNIKRNHRGQFWVALNYPKPTTSNHSVPVGVLIDEQGKIVRTLLGEGPIELVSNIEENDGLFYTGSPVNPYLGVIYY